MRHSDDTTTRAFEPLSEIAWSGTGIRITTVTGSFRPSPWTPARLSGSWNLTLARRGAYRRRADGLDQIVDATTGAVGRPGQEISTSTFTSVPEDVTVVSLREPFLLEVPELTMNAGPLVLEPSVALAHRALRRRLREHPDALGVESAVLELVQRCSARADHGGRSARRRATVIARRKLVSDAVEVLNASLGQDLGLLDIARTVGASPAHLSRTFRQVSGLTLSRYRLWLRVHAVLDRLEEGERDLAGLAAAAGFADHAHMTRTITCHFGMTPSSLRAQLAGALVAPRTTTA